MLLELHISNLILIESATIIFEEGFNALTGETGSGKSAVMAALSLIGGERADLSMIRHGCERGSVEALFALKPSKELTHLLDEAGIDFFPDEPMVIRREIAPSGKGRAYLNNKLVHVTFLRVLSPHLFEMVGQHANHKLFERETHQEILDFYADLMHEASEFSVSWQKEKHLIEQKEELIAKEAQNLRDIDRYQAQLEEISLAAPEEGEDETLFAEYTRIVNEEEVANKITLLQDYLIQGEMPAIALLRQSTRILEELTKLDETFDELAKNCKNLSIELQEIDYSLQEYLAKIEHNPERSAYINERLSLLTKLKKKYGPEITDILSYQKEVAGKLDELMSVDVRTEELTQEIEKISRQNNQFAIKLTEERQKGAKRLEAALTHELKSLNMPDAKITISITPQKRTRSGDDKIEIYMQPNKGEKALPIRECASGGEISRLLLCIQTLLAGKQSIPCLIFDEVDANIGGETATIVGEKMRLISRQHQLLCITHFPQVAQFADHHLKISKTEKNGRTITQVESVTGASRDKELARMRG